MGGKFTLDIILFKLLTEERAFRKPLLPSCAKIIKLLKEASWGGSGIWLACLHLEVFWTCGRRPRRFLSLSGLRIPWMNCKVWLGRWMSGSPYFKPRITALLWSNCMLELKIRANVSSNAIWTFYSCSAFTNMNSQCLGFSVLLKGNTQTGGAELNHQLYSYWITRSASWQTPSPSKPWLQFRLSIDFIDPSIFLCTVHQKQLQVQISADLWWWYQSAIVYK